MNDVIRGLGVNCPGMFVVWLLASLSCKAGAFEPLPYEGTPLVQDARVAFEGGVLPSTSAERLKIGFYNIEMFSDGIKDGKARTSRLVSNQATNAAHIIAELDPDILMISEIENDQALQILNDAFAMPYPGGYVVEFASGSGRLERMNIGMLSRFKPTSVQEVDFGPLAGPGRPTRGLFRAVFELDEGRALLVYACHLKANFGGDKSKNYSQRLNAMHLLREDAARVMAEREAVWEALVFGDFNTDPLIPEFADDPTLQALDGWVDLWSTHPDVRSMFSVPTRRGDPERMFPPVLFDRILASPDTGTEPWVVSVPTVLARGTDTENSKALPGEGGHVSDHYPIMVELVK